MNLLAFFLSLFQFVCFRLHQSSANHTQVFLKHMIFTAIMAAAAAAAAGQVQWVGEPWLRLISKWAAPCLPALKYILSSLIVYPFRFYIQSLQDFWWCFS